MNKQNHSQHPTTAARSSTDPKTPKAQAPELGHDLDPSMDGRDPALDGPSYSAQRPGQGEPAGNKQPSASLANSQSKTGQGQGENVKPQGSKSNPQSQQTAQAPQGTQSEAIKPQGSKPNPQSQQTEKTPEGVNVQGSKPSQQTGKASGGYDIKAQGSKPSTQSQPSGQPNHGGGKEPKQTDNPPRTGATEQGRNHSGSSQPGNDKQPAHADGGDWNPGDQPRQEPQARAGQTKEASNGHERQARESIGGMMRDAGNKQSKPYGDISLGGSAKGHKSQAAARIPGRDLLDERL